MTTRVSQESCAVAFEPGRQTLEEAIRELELAALTEALARSRYHQGEAARLLGLSYHQFRALYRKYKEQLAQEPGTGSPTKAG